MAGGDPYVDPVSGVLLNKLGIRDALRLSQAERALTTARHNALFAFPDRIEPEACKITAQLAEDGHLQGMETRRFIERTAEHIRSINALHPFRDGNGCTQRIFFEQLAKAAGRDLWLSDVPGDLWNRASADAHRGDMEGMRRCVRLALRAGARPTS